VAVAAAVVAARDKSPATGVPAAAVTARKRLRLVVRAPPDKVSLVVPVMVSVPTALAAAVVAPERRDRLPLPVINLATVVSAVPAKSPVRSAGMPAVAAVDRIIRQLSPRASA
jgi:hypothetical protein